jgi:site-specific DNA recombinase
VKALAAEAASSNGTTVSRLGDLNERIRAGEQRVAEMREREAALGREIVDESEVADALAAFDPVWETLSPREQARAVRLLVRRVEYDGEAGTVSLVFHPEALRGLADEIGVVEEVMS